VRGQTFGGRSLLLATLASSLLVPSGVWSQTDSQLDRGWSLGARAAAGLLGGNSTIADGSWVAAGQTRLYGMPELAVVFLQLGMRRRKWRGQPAGEVTWESVGDADYRLDSLRLRLEFGRQPAVGFQLRSIASSGGGSHWRANLTAFGRWGASHRLEARVWAPIGQWGLPAVMVDRQPLLHIQGWSELFAVAVAVDQTVSGRPTFGLEWDLHVDKALVGWRLDLESFSLGPVVYWRRGALILRTSHMVHPELGVTHRVQLGWGQVGAGLW